METVQMNRDELIRKLARVVFEDAKTCLTECCRDEGNDPPSDQDVKNWLMDDATMQSVIEDLQTEIQKL